MSATTVDTVTREPVWRSLVRAGRVAPSLTRGFRVTVLLALLGTGGQVVVPIVIQQILDGQVLAPGTIDLGAVRNAGAIALVALVVAAVANRQAQFRLIRSSADGLSQLRVATFRHVHDLSTLHVAAERRGTLVARVTSDIDAVTRFVEWGGIGMLVGSAQVVLVVVVMLVYDVRLAALVVGAAAIYAALLLLFQRVLRRAYDGVRVRVGESLGAVSEAIAGLPTIRAYGTEQRVLERVRVRLRAQFRAEFRTGALGASMFSTAELFAASVTAGVVVVGILSADAGMTAGQLVAFLFLVSLFIEPVQVLVEVLNEAQTAAAGVRRVLGILDRPLEVADPEDGELLPHRPLDVHVTGVRFRYPTGPDVLRDLDIDVAAGARVAVVGETGSGKSTFVKLLVRLLDPTEGTIEVGGVRLDRVAFASLRRRVAFVPQDGFLFDTTVVDNVRYGVPEATERDVWTAFAELELDGWLDRLPEGLATPVGERGSRLSAGERQLIALVRAWITAPDLLILDEATSAVDPTLEVSLRRAIERLTAGRTSITVAHRLSTAEAADEVLVFDGGALVERGHHDDLVAAGGVYARLHADWATGTT
ncbi:ABC transporter ATP-binding protein [Nitriliruptor alkaliphilus]|uniref:ABC transporter ATP-binding protein n=1 Tax=Nitriliruptor alkaliphilus TaxID=427918 RepID=UPI0012EDE007|nr:ABC transporter ATP-binding protein [Nitriliruptor alkaliphilus]